MVHHYRLAMAVVRRSAAPKSVAIFDQLLGGAAPEELAERHGTTAANVYKIKQRMRERLQEQIEQQLRDEQP